jgi:hypothetical protein
MINSAAAGGCLPPIALFDVRLPELRRAFLPALSCPGQWTLTLPSSIFQQC